MLRTRAGEELVNRLRNLYSVFAFVGLSALSIFNWPDKLESAGLYVVLAIWLSILGLLVVIVSENIKTGLLPNRLVYPIWGLSLLFQLTAHIFGSEMSNGIAGTLIGGVVVFLPLYILFQFTNGRWIGGGVVKLGAAIGFLLGIKLGLIAVLIMILLVSILALVNLVLSRLGNKLSFQRRYQTGAYWLIILVALKLFVS